MKQLRTWTLALGLLALAPQLHAQAAAPVAAGPQVAQSPLSPGGAMVYAMQDPRLPRAEVALYFEAGERFVPANKAGLTSVLAELLDRGPANVPEPQHRQELFRRGVELSWEPGNRFLVAHLKAAPADLAWAAQRAKATLLAPKLGAEEVGAAVSNTVTGRTALDDDMRQATFVWAKQALWGFAPGARLPEGWVDTLKTVNAADLQAFLAARKQAAGFVAAASPGHVAGLVAALRQGWGTGWPGALRQARSAPPALNHSRRLVLLDKPNATDMQIYALSPLPVPLDGPQGAAAEVYFAAMGMDLGARLGKTLRVERGLTYGANAGVRQQEWPSWYAYSFGSLVNTPKIVGGFFELFGATQNGLPEAEVEGAKKKLLQARLIELEGPSDQVGAVAFAVSQGLAPDHAFTREARLKAVTADQVRAIAHEVASLPQATLTVMGPAASLQGPLQAVLPQGTPIEVKALGALSAQATQAAAAFPSP